MMNIYTDFFIKFMEPFFEGLAAIFKNLFVGLFQMFNILNYINNNNNSIMNILASITAGAGLIVACDYYLQVRNDLKKASEEGFEIKNIKLKNSKDLTYALFDTKYYQETRNEPLIKKIGEIDYETNNRE